MSEETPASCEKDGAREFKCLTCGYVRTEKICATGHVWNAWKVETEPSSARWGKVTRICSIDGTHAESYDLPPLNKTDYEYSVILKPSCTQEGLETYTYKDENIQASFSIAIAKTEHDYKICYDGKNHWHSCSECGLKQNTAAHEWHNNRCLDCGAEFAEGLDYTLSEDGTYYEVAGKGEWQGSTLLIPEEHEGLPVKGIAPAAFARIPLKTVVIPSSAEFIGQNAFNGCRISELYFTPESSLKIIGTAAFSAGASCCTLTLPASVTEIGDGAFMFNNNIERIEFEDGSALKKIGSEAFAQCIGLKSITIPEQVEYIGERIAFGCTALSRIDVEEGLRYSGKGNCIYDKTTKTLILGTSSTTIPEGAEIIGRYAFSSCNYLNSLYIPKSVKSIDGSAFRLHDFIKLYYDGTASDWEGVEFDGNYDYITVYFYSESRPSEAGNYWHFRQDRTTPEIWNI